MAFNPATCPVQPIVSLTPFIGGKPWIKARVVDKGEIRTWTKPSGSGKLFACTLIDESSSIRLTLFNDGVDQFFPMLTNGAVFYFSGFSVKTANRRFSNVNNEYELSADRDMQAHLARDAASAALPAQRYNCLPISSLMHKEKGANVDVLAVVLQVGEASKIVARATGKELLKRTIKIADSTAAIDLTLWNDEALSFSLPPGTVAVIRNLAVNNFDGVSLGSSRGTTFDLQAESVRSESAALKAWYAATGGTTVSTLTTGRKPGEGGAGDSQHRGTKFFSQMEAEGLGKSEKGDLFDVRGYVSYIRSEGVFYEACPKCNKKIMLNPDGVTGRCEKCDSTVTAEPRYSSSIMISDNAQVRFATLFGDAGVTFWGCPAKALKLEMATDPNAIAKRASNRMHQPALFTIRAKEDRYDPTGTGAGEDRLKLTCIRVTDFFVTPSTALMTAECEKLLKTIRSYHI